MKSSGQDDLQSFFKLIPINTKITIETKRDDVISGQLQSVDDRFNLTLTNAKFIKFQPRKMTNKVKLLAASSQPPSKYYPLMVVGGCHVRCVQFDKEIPVHELMEKERVKLQIAKRKDAERYNTKRKPKPKPVSTRTIAKNPIIRNH